jgi:hypothetical protein
MSIASHKSAFVTRPILARIALSWLAGMVAAYFLTGFFSNFYPQTYQFVFLALIFQALCGIGMVLIGGEIAAGEQVAKPDDWVASLVLLIAFLLSVTAVLISWQFPGLFHRQILFMGLSKLGLFAVLAPISLVFSLVLLRMAEHNGFLERLKQTRLFKFTQENRPGIWLSAFFLFTYFVFAESINFPQFRTLDQYFDTDISVWLQRLTSPVRQDVSMVRAVHPALLLYLRPLVWFISLFLHGDRLHAIFVMSSMAGAGCVLLTWLIMKRVSGNTAYSLISAGLLGASASHLLLSSMFETYIYSALALLFFVFVLQNGSTSLRATVPLGILVFGITVTNLVQACILYLFKFPRLKVIVKYVLLVVLVTTVLNLLQVWLYPKAQSLLVPSSILYEQRYVFNPFDFSWRAIGRFTLTLRALLLYGVVAPTPFILTREIGSDVPNFRTYQIMLGEFHVAGYRGLADVTVKFWIVLAGIAGLLFLLSFFKSPKQQFLALSLLVCLGFSLALHLVYGDDPMLYSPDWVYALVLFVALGLQRWADRKGLQILLIIFLILLITTNLGLIRQIMAVSAPFYGTGN